QWNVHLLATGDELHALADDGSDVLAHIRGEKVFADPLTVHLLGELDELVVGLNRSESHDGYSLSCRQPNKKPAIKAGRSSRLDGALSVGVSPEPFVGNVIVIRAGDGGCVGRSGQGWREVHRRRFAACRLLSFGAPCFHSCFTKLGVFHGLFAKPLFVRSEIVANFGPCFLLTMPLKKCFAGVACGLHASLESRINGFLSGSIGFIKLGLVGFASAKEAFFPTLIQGFPSEFLSDRRSVTIGIKQRIWPRWLFGRLRLFDGLPGSLTQLGQLGLHAFILFSNTPLFLVD